MRGARDRAYLVDARRFLAFGLALLYVLLWTLLLLNGLRLRLRPVTIDELRCCIHPCGEWYLSV